MKKTPTKKTLKDYQKLKYPVTLYACPEGGYAVEIADLPGCISQGETVAEAMEMIEDARCLWLESAYEDGLEIPLPSEDNKFSGKFNVRVPASLHRKLHKLAKKEGVSLNQYVVYTLSHAAGVNETKTPYKK